jgi:hypothetical protein
MPEPLTGPAAFEVDAAAPEERVPEGEPDVVEAPDEAPDEAELVPDAEAAEEAALARVAV